MPRWGCLSPPYFYPRSPCGERRGSVGELYLSKLISIHALLAESDSNGWQKASSKVLFLSTLSLRRATLPIRSARHVLANFYPRSPCGERLVLFCLVRNDHNFYPRSPCGERLLISVWLFQKVVISIHALLAESDYHGEGWTKGENRHFYPRSPCGERQDR